MLKNLYPGGLLYTQVHAPDATRTDPIKLASSDGRLLRIPAPNTSRVVECARIYNNAGGTTATQGIYVSSTVGYALAVQFTY